MRVQLSVDKPVVAAGEQLEDEQATYLGFHWWTVRAIESSQERFYPGRLPDLIGKFLLGERIEEPFEHFS